MKAGSPQLQASRYTRHGALHLFAALSVADGKVYGMSLNRKRFVDFQTFILQTLIPEALKRKMRLVKLILDNGTTHAPKQLEKWLNALPVAQEGQLAFEVVWLPTNASWLDQMEIWFSILQRKCLQPNHFESLQDLEKTITDFIAYYNQEAKAIKWTYTVAKLEQKLEPRRRLQAELHLGQQVNQGGKENFKPEEVQTPGDHLKEEKRDNALINVGRNSDCISA